MKKLLLLSSLFSITCCGLPLFGAETTLESALTEYKIAARSGDLNQYTTACGQLIDSAKKADTAQVIASLKIVQANYPKHNHGRRIGAIICPKVLFPGINTLAQILSTRNDSFICHTTATLASFETTALATTAVIAACVTTLGAAAKNDAVFTLGSLVTLGASTAASFDWLTNYLNKTASEEKTRLDDMHKLTVQSLTSLTALNQKA